MISLLVSNFPPAVPAHSKSDVRTRYPNVSEGAVVERDQLVDGAAYLAPGAVPGDPSSRDHHQERPEASRRARPINRGEYVSRVDGSLTHGNLLAGDRGRAP